MTFILNLTQHASTKEQVSYGVVDLEGSDLALLKSLLTFEDLPSKAEIRDRAEKIAALAADHKAKVTMIGGAGYLLPRLTAELQANGVTVVQAFTKREVVESTSPSGEVIKTAVFRHAGFVEC